MENSVENQVESYVSLQLEFDCNENIDNIKSLPHKVRFEKDFNNNNFFNASLHCLTNIEILSKCILKKDSKGNKYIELISSLEDKDSNQNKNYINDCIKQLEQYIKEKKYDLNKKDNEDPRKLIEFILKDLLNEYLPNELNSIFQKKCNLCNNINDNLELNIIKFNIPEIIKNNNNKKLTILDCFNFYFKSLYCDK